MKPTWLTNFNRSKRPIYDEAIKIYNEKIGEEKLYIEEEAYDLMGRYVPTSNSLHTKRRGSGLDDFWEIFDKIEKSKK
jgi:hypothetical protein